MHKIFFALFLGDFFLCHGGHSLLSGKIGHRRAYIRETLIDMYTYTNDTVLSLSRHNVSHDYCVRIEWTGITQYPDLPLVDCFDVSKDDIYWYGGYETFNQLWPINNDVRPMMPFLPRDFASNNSMAEDWFGPILHPVWYNSKGVVLFVDEGTPLHVSIGPYNDSSTSQLCIQSLPYSLNCFPQSTDVTSLKYTVCGFQDVSIAAKFFLANSSAIDHPSSFPSIDLFLKPIWSTWAAFKTNISLAKIKEFVTNITQTFRYPISQLEIDDKYSVHYGELNFDPDKFPTNEDINGTLFSLGVPGISAWITPFIEPAARDFNEITSMGRCLPGTNVVDGNSVSLIKWWNGYAGVINFVDESTREWHAERLDSFVTQYSLSGLKFDAGGETYIPRCIYTEGFTHPGQFSKEYVKFVASRNYSSKSEVRVGYFSQGQPLFFRILDFSSEWGLNHGLQSVVTTVLSLGLAGYPFILPDMIGGNGYNGYEPSKELYIRWLQLNTFLPVMQLSYGPWMYNDANVTNHARDMMKLHEGIIRNYTIPLMSEAMSSGYPLIRPLWWIAPNDVTALTNRDQFLIGDTLMVAPVLLPNVTNRMVYFPAGMWQCQSCYSNNPGSIEGPTSHKFNVALTDFLYFKKCVNSC